MRNLSSDLAAHLAGGVTTLAHCWRIVRRDGVTMGFTDHDRDLLLGDEIYAAGSGFDSTQAEASLGLAVAGSELSGALMSASLSEADLSNGLYDGARVETWIVNWSDASQRHLLDVGTIGEVARTERAFTAEIRTLAHAFDQVGGRLFQAACSAELGDPSCKVSVANSAFSVVATVLAGSRESVDTTLGNFPAKWFNSGIVRFTSGALAGVELSIKSHFVDGEVHRIDFATPLTQAPLAGDDFLVTAGCDKTFRTCRDKFANSANFRGFPRMPGNDVLAAYASSSDVRMDGGSLFR